MRRMLIFMVAVAGGTSPLPAQTSARGTTITGLLMDASCPVITSGLAGSGSYTGSDAQVRHDGMTGSNAQSTEGSIARTRTEQEDRAARTKGDMRMADRTEKTASENPGTNTKGLTSPRKETQRTAGTAGPDRASATGTTGAASNTAPPQSGNLQSQNSIQGSGASDKDTAYVTGRDRSLPGNSGGQQETVREKYKACVVKSSTTTFAIHTDGKVYTLDQASNDMIRRQMGNEAFRANMSDSKGRDRFMTVTVIGTPLPDNMLRITSVRK